MTTEEKLKHFLDTCMEDARARSSRMLDEYTAALQKSFEEHKQDARRRAQMQVRQETEKIGRELNKKLSAAQLEQKRALGRRQEELKDKLFVELQNRLAEYRETPEYQKLLEGQITAAVDFAKGEEVVVYLDPSDADKLEGLALCHPRASLKQSDYSFLGGTRALIPARNILIDNSFQARLAEAKEQFHFGLHTAAGKNGSKTMEASSEGRVQG